MASKKERHFDAIHAALDQLLTAKKHKEEIGKDETYNEMRKIAWESARKAMAGYEGDRSMDIPEQGFHNKVNGIPTKSTTAWYNHFLTSDDKKEIVRLWNTENNFKEQEQGEKADNPRIRAAELVKRNALAKGFQITLPKCSDIIYAVIEERFDKFLINREYLNFITPSIIDSIVDADDWHSVMQFDSAVDFNLTTERAKRIILHIRHMRLTDNVVNHWAFWVSLSPETRFKITDLYTKDKQEMALVYFKAEAEKTNYNINQVEAVEIINHSIEIMKKHGKS